MPPDNGDADPGSDAPAGAAATGGSAGGIVVTLALLAFAGSALAFVAALATGADVRLPVGANAVAALVVVVLTARAAFRDPDSSVSTVPGAFGTALLVLGLYGLVVSALVWATGAWHDRAALAVPLAGAAAVAAVLGFVTFAFELVFDDGADEAGAQPPEGGADSPPRDGR